MSDDDQPPMNAAIEDLLAHSVSPEEDEVLLAAWIRLGAEYLARTVGRRRTRAHLQALEEWAATAQPAKPWRP